MLEKYEFLCLISGTGEINYENYLKQLCNNLNLHKKVVFTGFLDKDLIDYYCASDLFISTSISEAGPVSVFKALSLEIPVISTNTGVAFHILEEYQAGLIIDKNHWEGWSAFIEGFFKGEVVKTVDSIELKKEYGLRKGIGQLVASYEKSINNFYNNNVF